MRTYRPRSLFDRFNPFSRHRALHNADQMSVAVHEAYCRSDLAEIAVTGRWESSLVREMQRALDRGVHPKALSKLILLVDAGLSHNRARLILSELRTAKTRDHRVRILRNAEYSLKRVSA